MAKGIFIVLDSVGVGGAPDAKHFNDSGANTLGNIFNACAKGMADIGRAGELKIPNLESMGIYHALALAEKKFGKITTSQNQASYAIATSHSLGKDIHNNMDRTIRFI